LINEIKPSSSNIYYKGKYWNDHKAVELKLNYLATGDKGKKWYDYFFEGLDGKRFDNVLVLNCGNGWVEREVYQKYPVFNNLVGVDISGDLLDQARSNAGSLPFRYYLMDINSDEFPAGEYDLVINHAACHHIAYLDQCFQKLWKQMAKNAYFLNYDYVGPHRNQYPYEDFSASWELNETLPENLRKALTYPHLPTMLVTDPSEAVHSELILETIAKYFNLTYHKKLGGVLIYELLNFNDKFWTLEDDYTKKWINFLLESDESYTIKTGRSYFDFFICQPKAKIANTKILKQYEISENEREKAARDNGGLYYKKTLLQVMSEKVSDLSIRSEHHVDYIGRLHKEIDSLKNQFFSKRLKLFLKRIISR
jgi:SAM-dependent methyltransferase